MSSKKKHVYIIGSKGIPAKYGGFETFVEKLTENQINQSIQYHVACMKENSEKSNFFDKHFEYNGADCFNIEVPSIGPAKAIVYDVRALNYAIELATKNKDKNPIFYVLACRIGPFIGNIKKKIEKIDGKLFVNPDGHEWLREKWSKPVRKYWKESERLMVKHADLLICDSISIEKYIQKDYAKYNPKTKYIAYGTDTKKSEYDAEDKTVREWFSAKNIKENEYYLVVGRFVPENNYEIMIKEFMKSDTKKDFVLVTNIEKNKFHNKLLKETNFDKDSRIKFVGTVYNQNLLKYIRENAFAYLHGHEVGGTNPSLLEALNSTKINMLLDVSFNREVGKTGCFFWNKENLHKIIEKVDNIGNEEIHFYGRISKDNIADNYTWKIIIKKYEWLIKMNERES
ncbi:MAG TPA: glycosyl transferase [Enterococcus sp.]|nr:glycosyl transferase [Enterococcus sp.]